MHIQFNAILYISKQPKIIILVLNISYFAIKMIKEKIKFQDIMYQCIKHLRS